jgi:hypothetical protein
MLCCVLDTNFLLAHLPWIQLLAVAAPPHNLTIVVPWVVVTELDRLKTTSRFDQPHSRVVSCMHRARPAAKGPRSFPSLRFLRSSWVCRISHTLFWSLRMWVRTCARPCHAPPVIRVHLASQFLTAWRVHLCRKNDGSFEVGAAARAAVRFLHASLNKPPPQSVHVQPLAECPQLPPLANQNDDQVCTSMHGQSCDLGTNILFPIADQI